MRLDSTVTPILAVLLSACGGGGSSSTPPTGGGSIPTPSPSPTPTPTPTPFSYKKYSELTGSQTFASLCAIMNKTNDPYAEPPLAFGTGVQFRYIANEEKWLITGDTLDLEFNPNDLAPNPPPNTVVYTRQVVSNAIQLYAFVTPSFGQGLADYLRAGFLDVKRFDDQQKAYYCAFGVATEQSDALASSSTTYRNVSPFGGLITRNTAGDPETYGISQTSATIDFEGSSDELVLSVELRGELAAGGGASSPVEFGTFSATLAVDPASKQISGTLLDQQSNQVGKVEGQFFGPQGVEVAIAVEANFDGINGRPVAAAFNFLANAP